MFPNVLLFFVNVEQAQACGESLKIEQLNFNSKILEPNICSKIKDLLRLATSILPKNPVGEANSHWCHLTLSKICTKAT